MKAYDFLSNFQKVLSKNIFFYKNYISFDVKSSGFSDIFLFKILKEFFTITSLQYVWILEYFKSPDTYQPRRHILISMILNKIITIRFLRFFDFYYFWNLSECNLEITFCNLEITMCVLTLNLVSRSKIVNFEHFRAFWSILVNFGQLGF